VSNYLNGDQSNCQEKSAPGRNLTLRGWSEICRAALAKELSGLFVDNLIPSAMRAKKFRHLKLLSPRSAGENSIQIANALLGKIRKRVVHGEKYSLCL